MAITGYALVIKSDCHFDGMNSIFCKISQQATSKEEVSQRPVLPGLLDRLHLLSEIPKQGVTLFP